MWIFNIYTLMDPSLKQMRINTPGYGKKQPKNPDTVSLIRSLHFLKKSMRNFHVQVWNFVSIVSTHQSIWRKLLNSMQKSGRLMKQCLFMAGDIVKLHNNVIMRNSKSMLLSWKNTWKKSKSVEKIATATRKQIIQPLLCESRQTTWEMTSCFQLIMYRSVLQMNILLLLM